MYAAAKGREMKGLTTKWAARISAFRGGGRSAVVTVACENSRMTVCVAATAVTWPLSQEKAAVSSVQMPSRGMPVD